MGVAIIDWEKLGLADEAISEVQFAAHDAPSAGVNGCVITGLEDTVAKEGADEVNGAESMKAVLGGGREFCSFVMGEDETEIATLGNVNLDVINSPIKPATGWSNAPEGAKEFVIITSGGFVRRPCLLLKNDAGIYDTWAIYKSKKDAEPIFTVKNGEFGSDYVDEVSDKGEMKIANRNVKILELAPDGSKIRYWLSVAYDVANDSVWHPKTLYKEIVDNLGYIQPTCMVSGKNPEHAEKLLVKVWDHYCQWQADCLNYLMDTKRYQVIFSHLHNVDLVGHQFWHYAKHFEDWGNDEVFYQGLIEYTYRQTDDYLGRFVHYLDEGWSIIITSDHGLITEENHPPVLTEGCVSVPVMEELGYTVMKKDKSGKSLREVDWSKTRALAIRGGHIYINLKGRNATGIVEPEDKYDLEAQIISDLYQYKDPRTGKRVVSIALRNKDAIVLGMGGGECGDIMFFMEEGFNIIHMDSLSTQKGYFDTSVSPIFVAAGKGIKAGYQTERVIRQVDVAPTMAALLGVRMPAQSEGSVVHQILNEEF